MRVLTVLLVMATCRLAAAPLGAQTLADVAQREEQRRKAVKPAAKVYTNKELRSGQESGALATAPAAPPPAAPASGTEASTAAKPTEPPQEPDQPVKDQAYWAGRMKELRANLERDQTYVDALQSRVNALATDFVNRDDPAQRGAIANERQKNVAELERLKKAIVDTKKAIADLEEEARRAGVPPGWLR
jgi:hypothetical protein